MLGRRCRVGAAVLRCAVGRAFSTPFDMPRFDPRKYSKIHGSATYDRGRDIVLDDYVRERKEREEWAKTREFFRLLEASDLYYDIRDELKSHALWYRYSTSQASEPIPLEEPDYVNGLGSWLWDLHQIRERQSLITGESGRKLKVTDGRSKLVEQTTSGDKVIFDTAAHLGLGMVTQKVWQILDYSIDENRELLLISISESDPSTETNTIYSVVKSIKNKLILPARLLHSTVPSTAKPSFHPASQNSFNSPLLSKKTSRIVYVQQSQKLAASSDTNTSAVDNKSTENPNKNGAASNRENHFRVLCHGIGSDNSLHDLCLWEGDLGADQKLEINLSHCQNFAVLRLSNPYRNSYSLFMADLSQAKPMLVPLSLPGDELKGIVGSAEQFYAYSRHKIYSIPKKSLSDALKSRLTKAGVSQAPVLAHLMRKQKTVDESKSVKEIEPLVLQKDLAAIESNIPRPLLPGTHQPAEINFLSIHDHQLLVCLENRGRNEFLASTPNGPELSWNPHNTNTSLQVGKIVHVSHHKEGLDVWLAPFTAHREMYTLKFSMSQKSPVVPTTEKLYSVEHKRTTDKTKMFELKQQLEYAPCPDGTLQPLLLLYKGACRLAADSPGKMLFVVDEDRENYANITLLEPLIDRGWTITFLLPESPRVSSESFSPFNLMRRAQRVVSSTNYLVGRGFTHSSLLCGYAQGMNAAILAASVNMRPSAFKAVSLSNPLLDLVGVLQETLHETQDPTVERIHQKLSLMLGKSPLESAKTWDAVKMFCPVQNIQPSEYPSMLITHDKGSVETPYWNSLKYLSELRSKAVQNKRLNPKLEQFVLADADPALSTSYFEWVVEEMSTDLERVQPPQNPDYPRTTVSSRGTLA